MALGPVLLALAILLAAPVSAAEIACGETAPCAVPGGTYHLAAPAGWDGTTPLPAVLFFHGYGSSGAAVVGNSALRDSVTGRGYLLIAPDGREPEPGRRRSWAHQGSPDSGRDENAFIGEVMADVAARVPLRRDGVLVSGFSQGGSMAWHVACSMGGDFAAFAPVSGAFWRPHPEGCTGEPVRLLHLHGLADTVVPLEGRPIGERWHQGDVFEALAQLRAEAGCGSQPDRISIEDGRRCRAWTSCAPGGELELCLHDGGHELPADWLGRALDWFEAG
ncbi:MAG: polyhydroxybutyrate depolymerase [Geminicoccaceae bacterium]|jgi:polyhydroxybutyrate depolymerase|nr:polyhydroxybutyrate depolymerase [Geminicoccaceae bacterium]HRY24666.1 alpha/beta hydrolase-fold protein [Geminicoccaceae bacterium]